MKPGISRGAALLSQSKLFADELIGMLEETTLDKVRVSALWLCEIQEAWRCGPIALPKDD